MVGNGVVDLLSFDAIRCEHHPRFDSRVFARSERQALASSGVPGRLRWMLWGAKGSAYKLARRRRAGTPFSPRRFVVELAPNLEGVVHHGAECWNVRIEESGETIHAVATTHSMARGILLSDFRRARRASPGEVAELSRELALEAIAPVLGLSRGELRVRQRGRMPILCIRGLPSLVPLSLATHGEVASFACWLPSPRRDAASRDRPVAQHAGWTGALHTAAEPLPVNRPLAPR